MQQVSETEYLLFVGIDVAARTARVRWVKNTGECGDGFSIAQTPDSWMTLREELLALCTSATRIHVSLEATGSYYVKLAHFLYEHQMAVSVLNALRVKRFAEVYLQLDKTDDIDALTLAKFGAALRPPVWSPPPLIYEELFQRLVQRETLNRMLVQTVNRQKALEQRIFQVANVQERQEHFRKTLRQQIKAIDRELERVIIQDPIWAATAQRITSIPGVGIVTAVWLMMLTKNFTTCDSGEQLAAFVGLVPRRRQSGETLDSYRSVGHVGHDNIRQHLFVATMSALRYNPTIRVYYDRIKQRKGKHKLACVAATRKLIHIIFAIAKSDQPFRLNHTEYITHRQ